MSRSDQLAAKMEPFDSFWEGPADKDKGFGKFAAFYRKNYLPRFPDRKDANILVISCGPGYMIDLLNKEGYANVLGIDSVQKQVDFAKSKGLNSENQRAFEFLANNVETYDVIFCEQELNHLTKEEILEFLGLARDALKPGGTIIVHGLNGANPITGAECLAQNYDHYNSFTEYSIKQVLEYTDFQNIKAYPLDLYVFYKNPANYVLIAVSALLTGIFRGLFIMYGKSNKIFTKKIGAVARKAG